MKTYTKEEVIKIVKKARTEFWKHLNENINFTEEKGEQYVLPKDVTEMLVDEILALLEVGE